MAKSKFFIALSTVLGMLPMMGGAVSSEAAVSETLTFPSRASDLPAGSYWAVTEFSEGCCTLDLNVQRWDDSKEGSEEWVGGTGNTQNDQHLDWNVPLYAPANGVVISCWRNFPDDPQPSVNPPNNDNIFTGGNHVVILTDQGNAISLNHLKSGTVPPELCPRNADDTAFPSTMSKDEGDWRIAAYVEPADRPRIREGTFLGRVGNSGKSGGPHLHLSIREVNGTDSKGREKLAAASSPLKFRHGWGHRFENDENHTPDGWFRARGGDFKGDPACPDYKDNAPSCGFKMLHASPYLRRTDALAGAIKDGDVLFLSSKRAVTATVATSNDHLKLIAWDLVGINNIDRKGDIEAGTIKQVALSEPTDDHLLVAVRQGDDSLKMIAYRVTTKGEFVRVADYLAGKISALDMATIGKADKKAVTAVRDSNGNLKVIVWDVVVTNDDEVSIVRLDDDLAEAVSALSIAPARVFDGVFVAVRDSANELKVIPWTISDDGKILGRGKVGSAGEIGTAVAVAPLAQGVAAAMKDSGGNLRVITWSAAASGDIGKRHETGVGGDISEVKLLTTPLGDSNLTTIVRDAGGDLRLIGWAVDGDGTNLRRLGASKAGAVTNISADSVSRSYPCKDPRDMILTALRDSEGNLKLITWDTNLVNP